MHDSVDIVDGDLLQSMTDSIIEEVHPEEVVLFGSQEKGSVPYFSNFGKGRDFFQNLPHA